MSLSFFGFWVTCRRCHHSWVADHSPEGSYYTTPGAPPVMGPTEGVCLNCVVGALPGALIVQVPETDVSRFGSLVAGSSVSRFPTWACPKCGKRTSSLMDIEMGYCGACHQFTGMR